MRISMADNATLLHVIAAGHAMGHAEKKEAWTCECLACKFTREYKFPVRRDDGTIVEETMADSLLKTMKEQGYETKIPEPVS
jgi:hypothetical protein